MTGQKTFRSGPCFITRKHIHTHTHTFTKIQNTHTDSLTEGQLNSKAGKAWMIWATRQLKGTTIHQAALVFFPFFLFFKAAIRKCAWKRREERVRLLITIKSRLHVALIWPRPQMLNFCPQCNFHFRTYNLSVDMLLLWLFVFIITV